MTEYTEKKCPKCGQQLRFPKNVGGVLMACPSCGNEFHSDFKLGGTRMMVFTGEGFLAKSENLQGVGHNKNIELEHASVPGHQ